MATVTPVYNWPVPTSTDYVKDGATSIEALGDAIDASLNTITGGKNVAIQSLSSNTLTSSSGLIVTGLVANGRYRVSGILSSNNNCALQFRFRENTTDKATQYYWAHTATNLSAAFVGSAGNPDTVSYVGNIFSAAFCTFGFDVAISSNNTTGQIIGQYWDAVNGRHVAHSMSNANMTNCNGFNIYPSSGTLSGTISIMKYA
jgi:hypothetical protein